MIHADPKNDTPLVRKCIALGRMRGQREALGTVLESRGFEVSEQANLAIDSCDDARVLRRWISRAVTAQSVEAVLEV